MLKTSNIKSSAYLFLAALIWGVSFVFQSMGNNYMQPFTFNASRNVLAFFVLIPLVIIKLKKPELLTGNKSSEKIQIPKKLTVIGGLCCGVAFAAAGIFQQYGVKVEPNVGKAGFITTLYIIIIPILGLFFRKKTSFTIWIGAVAALIGLYLLCITDGFSLSFGDILLFLCALFFSIQIMLVDYFAPKTDGVVLSCIQFFVCSVICGVIALIVERPTFQQIFDGIIPLLYTGIMSSGVAYTFQILGQRRCNPTVAAMIMSLESVISAVAGYFAYSLGFLQESQTLTATQIIGCVIMFCAVIFVQLPVDRLRQKKG